MHTSTTSTTELLPWSADELAQATQGTWYNNKKPDDKIKRIVTNSRDLTEGDAFLALKGERFDAHEFLDQVIIQGAHVAIVTTPKENLDLYQLVVTDTRLALGHLGAYRRQNCTNLKVIALTGSSGKTTTKEMLGSIFNRLAPTLVTRGNLNNDLGVPIMLLELTHAHRYAIMELGANHQGEIDYTSQLVAPDVAGILNIGTAHLGEFGGRDGICTAKSEIYRHIKPQGIAIAPCEDDYAEKILASVSPQHQCIRFGQGGEIFATEIELEATYSTFNMHTPQGIVAIRLPFAGAHNIQNALAACAFALALDVNLSDIALGLSHAVAAKGRLNFIQHGQHTFIDDTYNANPTSMLAAAHVLVKQKGLYIMVMGDIGELGDSAQHEHELLGQKLSSLPIDYLVAVGDYAAAVKAGAENTTSGSVVAFETQAQAKPYLINLMKKHQHQTMNFLFKGSRFTHMETLMADLMETF